MAAGGGRSRRASGRTSERCMTSVRASSTRSTRVRRRRRRRAGSRRRRASRVRHSSSRAMTGSSLRGGSVVVASFDRNRAMLRSPTRADRPPPPRRSRRRRRRPGTPARSARRCRRGGRPRPAATAQPVGVGGHRVERLGRRAAAGGPPGRRGGGRRLPCRRSTGRRTTREQPATWRDLVDAAAVVAVLAEHLQRGVEDALLGALAPRPDRGVVGERRPAHRRRGRGVAEPVVDGAQGLRAFGTRLRRHRQPCDVNSGEYDATVRETARTPIDGGAPAPCRPSLTGGEARPGPAYDVSGCGDRDVPWYRAIDAVVR